MDIWITDIVRLVNAGATSQTHSAYRMWCYTVQHILDARKWRHLSDHELVRNTKALTDICTFPQVPDWAGKITHWHLRDCNAARALLRDAKSFATAFDKADFAASAIGWATWLADGSASTSRNIHRWAKNPLGWIPLPTTCTPGDDTDILPESHSPEAHLATPQQEVEDQAEAWAVEWGVGTNDIPNVQFPPIPASDIAPPPTLDDLYTAVRSFPCNTAIGSDAFHPRLLLRLSVSALTLILALRIACERAGSWPKAVSNVIIALLPKASGGLGPIGIFPSIIRI
jgi:hypothetical protein